MSNQGFISSIITTTKTLWNGISLTLRHFFQAKQQRKPLGIADKDYFNQQNGLFTTQYPHEAIPMPDNGRNRLNNEIEDCIVCDLCAKICPVDCIEIEAIKSTEEIGTTSDGSVKRLYAAKFDIDLAKCCYCGLCTTVCPTECLTMTNAFDYSEVNVAEMLYHYSNLSPAEVEDKKELLAEAQKLKAEQKLAKQLEKPALSEKSSDASVAKPVFKPTFKPTSNKPNDGAESAVAATSKDEGENIAEKPKPVFKPTFKPSAPKISEATKDIVDTNSDKGEDANLKKDVASDSNKVEDDSKPKPKPVFKPVFKPNVAKIDEIKTDVPSDSNKGEDDSKPKPKPVFKPVFKPNVAKIDEIKTDVGSDSNKAEDDSKPKPKPVLKPVFKPNVAKIDEIKTDEAPDFNKVEDDSKPKPKFVFKPTFKPKLKDDTDTESPNNS